MDLSSFLTPATPSSSTAAAAPPASSPSPAPSVSAPAPESAPAAAATPASSASDDLQAADPQVGIASSELAFTLPADFQAPDGIKLGQIDASAPLAVAAREFAQREGLSQAQFSGLLGIYAKNAVTEIQNHNRAIAAEGKKLGPEAAKRGAAVKQFLVAKVGAEVADDWSSRFHRASDIEALEKLAGTFKREVVPVRDGGQAGAPSPGMAQGLWPKRLGVPSR